MDAKSVCHASCITEKSERLPGISVIAFKCYNRKIAFKRYVYHSSAINSTGVLSNRIALECYHIAGSAYCAPTEKWKSVATVPVRKRCAPLSFTREDIPKSQRSRALQSFCQLIRATNDLEEFPVTEFHLELNSEFYWNWIEMYGSTLISHFLEAVSPFVKHINFYFGGSRPSPNNCLAIPQNLTFTHLTKITLETEVEVEENEEDNVFNFSFIRKIIEKCPNIKEFHTDVCNIRRGGAIRRCIGETGIEQKASLVTSFSTNSLNTESDWDYLNKLGFKLKHFYVNVSRLNGNMEIFKEFIESQSDTLTTLCLSSRIGMSSQYFRELPCLPHLKNLSISFSIKKGEEQFPTLFYKEQLPALKKLSLTNADFAASYFVASHMTPSDSLRELILPKTGIDDAGVVIRQVARVFPNLKKLQVFHESAGRYMSDVYEELPGIEKLCIMLTDANGSVSVDNIITGLPERFLRKIKNEIILENRNTPYHLSKALAMLERATTKTLACLENLKILMIYRRCDVSADIVEGADFTELSGVVLKQMKGLQRIDFGIRKYGPIVSVRNLKPQRYSKRKDADLKEDLEAQGIKLLCRRPPFVRPRTEFIVSLTESDDPDSDSDY